MQNLKYSALKKIVLIGASAGGPGHIEKIIKSLNPLQTTTLIIAQHMINEFIPSFIKRLKITSQNQISMAQNATSIEAGSIYICSGHTRIIQKHSQLLFLQQEAPEESYNPNIDLLFNSFANLTSSVEVLVVILTGIGADGVNGCNELSLKGAVCITEDESAIVDGMPARARASVINIKAFNIEQIIQIIKDFSE